MRQRLHEKRNAKRPLAQLPLRHFGEHLGQFISFILKMFLQAPIKSARVYKNPNDPARSCKLLSNFDFLVSANSLLESVKLCEIL